MRDINSLPPPLQPKVTLISCTPQPLAHMVWVCQVYDGYSFDSIDAMISKTGLDSPDKMMAYLQKFIEGPHQLFMEYVQTVWLFENVSRVFQQQLTRHRLASYAIESLRVVNVGKFAELGKYHMPSTVQDADAFKAAMLSSQDAYNDMIAAGENVEDARNALPLNIHSTITMRTDFAQIKRILQQRLCLTAQEEWRTVAYLMKDQVRQKMGQALADMIQPPCHAINGGKCNRERFYCGVPLYLASTDKKRFARWYKTTLGRPDGSKIPTNTVLLEDDYKEAARLATDPQMVPMTREELDAVMPGRELAPAYVTPKTWEEQQREKEAA